MGVVTSEQLKTFTALSEFIVHKTTDPSPAPVAKKVPETNATQSLPHNERVSLC